MSYTVPEFRPFPFLGNGHLLTLASAWLTKSVPDNPVTGWQRVELPDGDSLLIADEPAEFQLPDSRCVLFVHGLAGSASSPHIMRMAQRARQRGYRTIRVNLRGASCNGATARKPYHAGCSEDIQFLMTYLAERAPETRFCLTGFSLGGNIILKWAGETGSEWSSRVIQVIAANPPVDLAVCASRISTALGGFYDRYFAKILYQKVRAVPHWWELSRFCRMGTRPRGLLEFDDAFTAPLNNFATATEYYADASSQHLLNRISLPTVIVSAKNDPLVPCSIFDVARESPNIKIHLARSGGHLAYYGNRGDDPDGNWLDWRILDWIERGFQVAGPVSLSHSGIGVQACRRPA